MRLIDYLVAYSWIAAAVNIVILAGLAAMARWWTDAPQAKFAAEVSLRGFTPRWFWPALLAATITAGTLAAPRLTQSLWDDEETSLRFSVLGKYIRQAPEGNIRLKEAPWRNTLFYYESPNNHVFHNALARIFNSGWRTLAKPGGLQFKEWVLRIPAFLAGLATLTVIALLLRDLGMPLAGVTAAWFLALHPWFNKYCAEARGYTLAMLLLYAALLFWRRGLISGGWKWWSLFATSQALCLWTWPGALFFFVLLNAGTLYITAAGTHAALPRRTVLSRWFCCNALAGIALIQLMLPLFPQMGGYLEQQPTLDIGAKWFADVACYLSTGSPWTKNETGAMLYPEIRAAARMAPVVFQTLMTMGLILLAAGVLRWVRAGPIAIVVLISAIGATTIQVAQAVHERMFIFEWYVVYLLPLLAAVFAAGLAWLAAVLQKARGGKVFASLAVLAVFVLFTFASQPARARGLNASTVAFRESVLLTRPNLDPLSPENARVITVGLTNPAFIYDANLFLARSPRDLLLLCAQADTTGRPLWLNLGHIWVLRERSPVMQRIVEHPELFTDRVTLRGEYPHCDRMVCRYVPGSLQEADLAEFLSPEDIAYVRSNTEVAPEKHFAP